MSVLNISRQKWLDLVNKKIFFGHMSIGCNIISGIKEFLQQHPEIKLNIDEIEKGQIHTLTQPVLVHSPIGGNEDPKSKIDAFVNLMAKGMAKNVDMAFFKLCYVDIHARTDINSLFKYYKSNMEKLSSLFPETIFLHITTPLTSHQTGTKAVIKKIIGKPLRGVNNRYREAYNEMMRTEYHDRGVLFDLALVEASSQTAGFQTRANIHPNRALLSAYTDDGCHLNSLGSKMIAEQLLAFLISLT
jgi:hypothetical protein